MLKIVLEKGADIDIHSPQITVYIVITDENSEYREKRFFPTFTENLS